MLTICSSKKLLDSFIESNRMLDSVQKGLADYLETKRLAFARFFFLSNDELLQILSQTKNPLAVQPHLRKCFEAIACLVFKEDLEITAMKSMESEEVPFAKTMYPTGNVESWLGVVEQCMKEALRDSAMNSIEAYKSVERKDWVKEWPAMIVLAVSSIYWTEGVESALTSIIQATNRQQKAREQQVYPGLDA